eukprot:TRINITY_DN74769_c0_g1_i1.p1 TRINITY_DN74769_c0_g1~~TRINITY_DN74769_c0_g1_i1.p1  ORF type:complete len:404 (+),score=74.31 TRINITY_DN74769_c0_g1_i1:47-1213(+)
MMASSELCGLLAVMGVQRVHTVAEALARVGIVVPADLHNVDSELLSELDAELKVAGVSIGDRAKIRTASRKRLWILEGGDSATDGLSLRAAAPFIEALPTDVFGLRKAVSAVGLPEEGMRGSAADGIKLRAASDPAVLEAVRVALRGPVRQAAAAAATIRSISISPQAAVAACAGGVASRLCERVGSKEPVRSWAVLALLRLAQYRECHAHLLSAGAVQAIAKLVRVRDQGSAQDDARLDLVASVVLAFLSETGGPPVAMQVPLRAIPDIVAVLRRRLFAVDPQQILEERLFFGLEVYFRRCFIVHALARVIENSAAHGAVALQTTLPELVCGILGGIVVNDTDETEPYGSPDVVKGAVACGKAMLACKGGDDFSRLSLQEAVLRSKL